MALVEETFNLLQLFKIAPHFYLPNIFTFAGEPGIEVGITH